MHFGDSLSVSIEGYTVHYRPAVLGDLVLDFHSVLSDGKVQDASSVCNHLDQLIKKLKDTKVLASKEGRILSFTDGCAAQYRSSTSLYFMTLLAYKHDLVIDRGIGAAGHGKSVVDAINGVDKNTVTRRLNRSVVQAEDALDKKSKSVQVHSYCIPFENGINRW